ncbi:MAG: (2Fe-2S) ferredoxin domain-containing protein, partial [Spirochaetales bacterium]
MSYPSLKSIEDLKKFREKIEKERTFKRRVLICMTGCRALGAEAVGKAFRQKIGAAGLSKEVDIVDTGCHGQCSRAPVVVIEPENFLYGGVKPEDVDDIIETTLKQGLPVERLCARDGEKSLPTMEEVSFYSHQK